MGKIYNNGYEDADCKRLIEYANAFTALIYARGGSNNTHSFVNKTNKMGIFKQYL